MEKEHVDSPSVWKRLLQDTDEMHWEGGHFNASDKVSDLDSFATSDDSSSLDPASYDLAWDGESESSDLPNPWSLDPVLEEDGVDLVSVRSVECLPYAGVGTFWDEDNDIGTQGYFGQQTSSSRKFGGADWEKTIAEIRGERNSTGNPTMANEVLLNMARLEATVEQVTQDFAVKDIALEKLRDEFNELKSQVSETSAVKEAKPAHRDAEAAGVLVTQLAKNTLLLFDMFKTIAPEEDGYNELHTAAAHLQFLMRKKGEEMEGWKSFNGGSIIGSNRTVETRTCSMGHLCSQTSSEDIMSPSCRTESVSVECAERQNVGQECDFVRTQIREDLRAIFAQVKFESMQIEQERCRITAAAELELSNARESRALAEEEIRELKATLERGAKALEQERAKLAQKHKRETEKLVKTQVKEEVKALERKARLERKMSSKLKVNAEKKAKVRKAELTQACDNVCESENKQEELQVASVFQPEGEILNMAERSVRKSHSVETEIEALLDCMITGTPEQSSVVHGSTTTRYFYKPLTAPRLS